MAVRFVAAVLAVSLLASAPAAALELDSVQVHLGMADLNAILDGSKAVPLIEPTVEVEPAFSGEIDSYTLQVPDGVDGITLVLEAQQFDPLPVEVGVLDVNGVSGEFRSVSYSAGGAFGRSGAVIPLQLEPGDNHIRFGAKSHFGDVTIYKLLVTRETERSGEATLAALALSRGVLEPPFHSDVLSYRTRVAGDSVALSVQTTQGGSVAVQGIGPDGKLLRTEGLAVLELGAGENAIIVSVTGGEGSAARHYLIRAEASDIVRDVLAGDLISIPDDCDGAVGCPGTLNGVKGRFACGRGGAASNSGDAGPPADAPCSISPTSDGGLTKVGSAVGWYFWVFPE